MTTTFNVILPGSRWKVFLPRAALNGSQSTLDCGDASAAVAKKWSWSWRAGSRRGVPAQPCIEPNRAQASDSRRSARHDVTRR
jgi:hypothetical protein